MFLPSQRDFTILMTYLHQISKLLHFLTETILILTKSLKYMKLFKFTNFDKDYTFWQTLNNIRHNVYHSWDKISYLININNLLLNFY